MNTILIIRYRYFFLILILLLSHSFLAPAQTKWYKYPGNPVFSPRKSGEWDRLIFSPSVIYEDRVYHLWYVGTEKNSTGYGNVGYATSTDGIHWEKYEGNPLQFKCAGVSWDTTIIVVEVLKKGSMYYMWYTGESKENWLITYIGYAWSDDGTNWTKHPDPVLKPGIDDDWDAQYVSTPKVMFDERMPNGQGEQFHMWYTGVADQMPRTHRVGYATSKDGIHWEKYEDNPVLDLGGPDSWDSRWVVASTVNFKGSSYEMWYYGFDDIQYGIGFATSIDGINWIRYPGNPVLNAGELGTWDSGYALYGQVELIGDSVYQMWYCGGNQTREKFGYATTSVSEAKSWDTTRIDKFQREVRVKVFNRTDYIKLDSLFHVLPELSGTELIDAYNKLALAYSLTDEVKSFHYAENALELAQKINYPEGKAMALYSKGNCQYVMDNYAYALANQLSALRIFDSLDMLYEVGNLLSQIASIHTYTGSNDLATRYYKQSLEAFEELHDTGSILLTLEYLGYSDLKGGDTSNAIITFQRRLTLANWDTLHWLIKGINYCETAEAYFSFGPEYYQQAEEYFLKSYEYYKIDGGESKIMFTYGMAELYLNTGRYEKVKELLDLSLYICRSYLSKINHQSHATLNKKMENEIYLKTYIEKIYRLYFRLDTTLNDDVAAWKHLAFAQQWKDSIYNQQNRRQWAMLQGQYETESAQRHIDALEKENEVKELRIKQSRIYFFASVGFILILVLIGLLFFRQRKIKTLVREQKLQHDLELKKIESEKLKELDHLKSRFFANISHEFRTPLTLILGPLEKMLSKIEDDHDKKELGIAKKYAGKLQILINNLLTISKLESGKMQLHASETYIVKLVRSYLQSFESLAKQKNISLKFTGENEGIKAFIDREKFEQVLNNLLSNAFKFTGEGGRINVEITPLPPSRGDIPPTTFSPLEGGQRGVEIKISDTGRGISPEHIDHIFDRFYQVEQEDSSYYEGTGIGLALTKELIELHHGRIEVESTRGKGSIFTFSLPLGKDHLKPEEIEDEKPVEITSPTISPSLLIHEESDTVTESITETNDKQPILLIVEDNADMRSYIREYFEKEYHIIEAVDGLDGYEKSTEHIPDIIISDVMMPKMDGNEFCRKVKTDERTSHIPVVLLTARASSEYKIEGLETGADDYISKPFDPKELQIRIKNLILQRQKLREKFVADFWKGDQSPTIQIPAADLNPTDKKFLQKALDTVALYISDPEFNVILFSREMAMSRQQMHRKFRAIVDQSATEFIRVIRLKKAAELLSKKTSTVSEIAYDVGFSSLSYFTRSFQQQFGIAPSEYAENHSKT
jgi:signal transduction histidine kinase/DNA-binding response OmpR family regulator/predicted GH43/DUF377 family glycosyl hydrolase